MSGNGDDHQTTHTRDVLTDDRRRPGKYDGSCMAAAATPPHGVLAGLADSVTDHPTVWEAFLVAFCVTILMTPLVARFARRIGAVDDPGEERRQRVHARITPRLGGIAVLAGVLIATLLLLDWSVAPGVRQIYLEQFVVSLACAAAITLVGAIDDVFTLGWRPKLGGQVLVSGAAVLGPLLGSHTTGVTQLTLIVRRLDPPLLPAVVLPPWLGVVLGILVIVAMMNMVNFIDGVDGLAAGTCAISLATFAIVAASYGRVNVAVLAAAAAGASTGFLRDNFFRRGGARIFLGDSGSLLLGFLLAVIAVQGVLKTAAAVSLVIPLALVAVPLLDTIFVVAKRAKYGVSFASPDLWHLHHRLLNVGFSPRRVTVSLWTWTASMSLVALALRFAPYGKAGHWNRRGLAMLLVVGLLAIAVSLYLAVSLEIIKLRHVRQRNARLRAARLQDAARADDDGAHPPA